MLPGFARVFFDVGYQSYVPEVIGKDHVLAGNSAMEALRSSGQVLGPGVGGALVAALGAASVVLIQSVTFAVSAGSLLAIRTREPVTAADHDRPPLRRQIAEGLRFVGRNSILRSSAIASAAANFSFAIASAVTFIFMSRTLHLSPALIGLIVAAGSMTVMLGAVLTPVLSRVAGSARIIWLSLLVTAPLALLTALAQPGWSVVLVVVGFAAGEFGQIVYSITNVSMRQRLCPDRMLGRVNATMRFLIMGLFPLGALVGGGLGELIGLRGTLWVAGGILLLCPIPLYLALRKTPNVEDIPAW
jgi:Na+/melibiose symporter-like transporter